MVKRVLGYINYDLASWGGGCSLVNQHPLHHSRDVRGVVYEARRGWCSNRIFSGCFFAIRCIELACQSKRLPTEAVDQNKTLAFI